MNMFQFHWSPNEIRLMIVDGTDMIFRFLLLLHFIYFSCSHFTRTLTSASIYSSIDGISAINKYFINRELFNVFTYDVSLFYISVFSSLLNAHSIQFRIISWHILTNFVSLIVYNVYSWCLRFDLFLLAYDSFICIFLFESLAEQFHLFSLTSLACSQHQPWLKT